jgi:hypothetical protein
MQHLSHEHQRWPIPCEHRIAKPARRKGPLEKDVQVTEVLSSPARQARGSLHAKPNPAGNDRKQSALTTKSTAVLNPKKENGDFSKDVWLKIDACFHQLAEQNIRLAWLGILT